MCAKSAFLSSKAMSRKLVHEKEPFSSTPNEFPPSDAWAKHYGQPIRTVFLTPNWFWLRGLLGSTFAIFNAVAICLTHPDDEDVTPAEPREEPLLNPVLSSQRVEIMQGFSS